MKNFVTHHPELPTVVIADVIALITLGLSSSSLGRVNRSKRVIVVWGWGRRLAFSSLGLGGGGGSGGGGWCRCGGGVKQGTGGGDLRALDEHAVSVLDLKSSMGFLSFFVCSVCRWVLFGVLGGYAFLTFLAPEATDIVSSGILLTLVTTSRV